MAPAAPAAPEPAAVREPVLVGAPVPELTLPSSAPLPPVPAFRTETVPSEVPLASVPVEAPVRRSVENTPHPGRRRTLLIAGVVVVLAAAGGGTALLLHKGEKTVAVPAPAPVVRTQSTVLFTLADPNGDEAALLAADPQNHTGSVTLLPSRTITNVPSGGQLPLGKAVAVADPAIAAAGISDLLHVTVDGTWRIDPATLARLVDAVGGVQVTVDRQIVVGGVIVLNPGLQHLAGAAALQFAQYLADNEDESARLARLQAVLSAVLTGLPADAGQVQNALAALGGGSVTSVPPATLAADLLQLHTTQAAATGPVFAILPVVAIDSGVNGPPSYRVDQAALSTYVSANLAASVPKGALAGAVRVFVYNGTLDYGVGAAARSRLVAAGMSFVGSGNDTTDTRTASVVLVRDDTPAARAQGLRVATALGLPATSLQINPSPQDISDVVVITGADFKIS